MKSTCLFQYFSIVHKINVILELIFLIGDSQVMSSAYHSKINKVLGYALFIADVFTKGA